MAKIKLVESSDEFKEIEASWYKEIDGLTSQSKLNNFIAKLSNGYEHDFGTSLRALACIVNATIRFYGGGLHPIQANYLMWQIIRKTFGFDDEIGLYIAKYEDILEPSNNGKIMITNEQHKKIIEIAQCRLNVIGENDLKKEHLEKIVSGWLPDYCELEESEVKA